MSAALKDIDGNDVTSKVVEIYANYICGDVWYDTKLAMSMVPFEQNKFKEWNQLSYAWRFILTDGCGEESKHYGNTPYITFHDVKYDDMFCLTNHKDYISTSADFSGTQRHRFVETPCHHGKVCYKVFSTASGEQYGFQCKTGNIRTYYDGSDLTFFYFKSS
ncbi:hypothetical protein BGW38_003023 [Lunasporangiospora selenospora]|uniref:Uncharacterized protein n=1 Tax=Lunasporangiospora selenospora TaxID=979761 RepID=A0A9P6FR80_9FUNG|nr:hypothetical protein BGW38_003023 [Lunasporangiospora selenospora]